MTFEIYRLEWTLSKYTFGNTTNMLLAHLEDIKSKIK